MMKILALAGSPRKGGNSDLLLDEFIAGAAGQGAEVEKVYLNGLQIRGCQACGACQKTGRCKQRDDMTVMYDKLLSADLWAIATPVYWWGPSAQTKLMIDRWYALCFGPNAGRLKGKKAVLIATFEDEPKNATPFLVGMLRKAFAYVGIDFAGRLLVQALAKGEVKNQPAALKKARKMGEKLAG
jgi:multimeric flavodoxin WrbA